MIFIPNYFDFVRLRNHFIREDIGFTEISEYAQACNGLLTYQLTLLSVGILHVLTFPEPEASSTVATDSFSCIQSASISSTGEYAKRALPVCKNLHPLLQSAYWRCSSCRLLPIAVLRRVLQ